MVSRIKDLCKKNKIALSFLEKELGLSQNSIYRWDKASPSFDKVEKVAMYFGVSIDYLCGRSETSHEPSTAPQSNAPVRYITDDDLRFALWNGKAATEAQLKEVKSFAAFVMERDEGKVEK